ncbi:uncharacterized protein LOC118741875, partial [Rhagoletis pomonella]|uniref:uncharacterized protein LOC118741875 n=1 Tax=Rhagoletis pomonella TaxID=28610 RepID=UPI00177BC841
NSAEIFAKMQKFYILAFVIAPVLLVFADVNGFAESGQQQATGATTTPRTTIVGATAEAVARATKAASQSTEAKTVAVATQTLTATTTATAAAAAATTTAAITVTLASSNAPATLTATNDADERVLSTAIPETPAGGAVVTLTAMYEQAKRQQQQQQQHKATQTQKDKEIAAKKRLFPFSETNGGQEEPTATATSMPTKINAAAMVHVATRSGTHAHTATTSAIAGEPATKITEVLTVNFESKSHANTLPSGKGAAGSGAGAGEFVPQQDGNEAETQIIKRVNEQSTKSSNERGVRRANGEEKTVTETNVANGGHGVRREIDQQAGGIIDDSRREEVTQNQMEIISEVVRANKPRDEAQKAGWSEGEASSNRQEEELYEPGTTKVIVTKSQTTQRTSSEHAAGAQQAMNGMNTEQQKLKNGLYRIKLAEIVTDEYNGRSAEQQQSGVRQLGADNGHPEITATDIIPNMQVEGERAAESEEPLTTTPQGLLGAEQAGKQLGQLEQQTSTEKQSTLDEHNSEQQRSEQKAAQQQKQQQQRIQLRREQQANNGMENRQVQQDNEHTASQLEDRLDRRSNNSSGESMSNKQINNNKEQEEQQQQSDHTKYTTPAFTGGGPLSAPLATPPALNIVDLYPMKMEDFNPIIRDSNAKLLKERTVYKAVEKGDDNEQGPQVEPTAVEWYGNAKAHAVEEKVVYLPADSGQITQRQQQNLLPNEVDTVDNIVQRYDNINNLAAHRSINRRPIMLTKSVEEKSKEGAVAGTAPPRQPDDITDFTGKVLAEQDGVITEIEQKFRLNEFAPAVVAVTGPVTGAGTAAAIEGTAARPESKESAVATSNTTAPGSVGQLTSAKSSYSVNHKIQPPQSIKNKYASNKNNENKKRSGSNSQRLPAQHDFIERRVKKSFDFPMHRAASASASDTLTMPHVDFANTKFNTGGGGGGGATQAQGEAATNSGTESGDGGAMRAALGTHPEFSTTKFYNSKELYNEMMQHNRKRLKAKSKMEQAMAGAAGTPPQQPTITHSAATTAASSGGAGLETAASRFALHQNAKLETLQNAKVAEPSKPIMGEVVNMNSKRGDANGGSGGTSEDKEGDASEATKSGIKQTAQSVEKAELGQPQRQRVQQQQQQQNALLGKPTQLFGAAASTASAERFPSLQSDVDKPTKKYQKELQRAKLLLKSMLLPSTNANGTRGANKSIPNMLTAATSPPSPPQQASTSRTTINNRNGSQLNLHAPSSSSDVSGSATAKKLSALDITAAGKVDLVASGKTFDIMSQRRKSNVVVTYTHTTTPTLTLTAAASSAAVGNIDSTIDSSSSSSTITEEQVRPTQAKRVNFAGAGIVHVKRAKLTPTTATTTTKIPLATTASTNSELARVVTSKLASDDPTTPSPLIYPYPQLHPKPKKQALTHLSQPHDTTAAISSTSSTTTIAGTIFSSSHHTTTPSSTTNLTKSPSKPIGRPRILSPLQEKINSLECELQNVPSDSHLWRGNETHELLLPIVTSENCPYGGTDCSPLLVSWEGEAEIQSGDILIVEINDTLLNLGDANNTHSSLAHNTQVYQVTRSGHEHCDVTEGILLDITPLFVDGRKLVTLYDKDLTEGVNLLIVVSELWGSQCVRLKVTAKTDNCGENAECSGKGVCYSNSAMEEYECQCCSGFAGPHCEEIDACTPSPCTNNGICVDLSQGHEGNSYQCLCPYGYTGKNCQYESDPCNSAECLNGGSCVGNSTHFRCDCTPGYNGPLCQHSLNECESSPCVHGICVDQEDGFRCFCQPGFAGELCNFEYNECESNPCQNDGECIDHIGNFECRCTKGYTGARCQIKVDFCANKPCPDGHRCMDHGNDFSCECPGGRNGLDCNQMPRKQCNENLCKHGGTCWTSGASFYCACRPGYTGNMCEDEFVVETVVSSSEFMVDDTSARNFNDKTFGSSVVLKSPIELHNAYFGAGVLAAAVFIVAVVVAICHCKVNQTYRKFSTRSSTFFPILGFGRRNKSQSKLNKHWLSGKGLGGGGGGGAGNGGGSLRSSGSTTSLTRGHLPSAHHGGGGGSGVGGGGGHQSHQRQQQLQQQQLGGQMHERPFQRHLAMNLENDMYYTVDFSENSQHSPLIQ